MYVLDSPQVRPALWADADVDVEGEVLGRLAELRVPQAVDEHVHRALDRGGGIETGIHGEEFRQPFTQLVLSTFGPKWGQNGPI